MYKRKYKSLPVLRMCMSPGAWVYKQKKLIKIKDTIFLMLALISQEYWNLPL